METAADEHAVMIFVSMIYSVKFGNVPVFPGSKLTWCLDALNFLNVFIYFCRSHTTAFLQAMVVLATNDFEPAGPQACLSEN